MLFFTSPSPIYQSFQKSFKNDINFLLKKKEPKLAKKLIVSLEMKKKNLINSKKIQNYQNYLPKSFVTDNSAPFYLSFMWLQRIGRLDLNENLSNIKNSKVNIKDFQINFKSDPMFRLSKKNKKKKKEKFFSSISVGKNIEEKMVLFDYYYNNNNKKSFSSSNSYSKEILKKKENLKFTYYYSIISIQIFQINKFTKFVISFVLLILSFLIFSF